MSTAAGTTLLPVRGGGDTYFYVDGRPPATDADKLNATVSVVTDDYFETMRIPVRSGRAFTGTDRADGPGVLLINEGLARRLFPGGNAVGERLIVDFGKPFRGEIVGVVSDVRIYGQTNEVPDQMYFSSRQPGAGFSATQMRLVARVQGDPTAITPQVRAVLRELDPDVPLASMEPMEDILSGSIRDVRFRAGVLAGFDVFQDPAALTIGDIRGGALFEQGDINLGAPAPEAEQALGLTERPAGQRRPSRCTSVSWPSAERRPD